MGVVEYFNKPNNAELNTGQGSKIEYLKVSKNNNSMYRECDPDLYDALQQLLGWSLVYGKELNLAPSMARHILPIDARYHNDPIPVQVKERANWHLDAIQKVREANLVFVNPDNGIATPKMHMESKNSPNKKRSTKHIYIDELQQISETNKILIIYQHPPMFLKKENKERWIVDSAKPVQHELESVYHVWAYWWGTIAPRAYFIVARIKDDKDNIEKRLDVFRQSPWMKKGHFTEVEIPQCPSS